MRDRSVHVGSGVRPRALAKRTSWVSRRSSACATASPERRDRVVASPLVVERGLGPLALFGDQAVVEHALDRPVERAGAQLDVSVGSRGDVLNDRVSVTRVVCERHEDMERRRRERQLSVDVVFGHGSNISSVDIDTTDTDTVGFQGKRGSQGLGARD